MTDVEQNRREWIRALESGEYQQTQRRLATVLTDQPNLCCIGVECLVNASVPLYELISNNNADYVLSRNRLGMNVDVQDHLISMNDTRKRDFRFIARFLRKLWRIDG